MSLTDLPPVLVDICSHRWHPVRRHDEPLGGSKLHPGIWLDGNGRSHGCNEDQNQAILGIGFVVGWTLLTLGTIAIAGPAWALTSICGGIFLFGRPLHGLISRNC